MYTVDHENIGAETRFQQHARHITKSNEDTAQSANGYLVFFHPGPNVKARGRIPENRDEQAFYIVWHIRQFCAELKYFVSEACRDEVRRGQSGQRVGH
jgi:hypothetical protein